VAPKWTKDANARAARDLSSWKGASQAFEFPATSERTLGLRSKKCKRKIWIISIQKLGGLIGGRSRVDGCLLDGDKTEAEAFLKKRMIDFLAGVPRWMSGGI
jgi:hypothetical protein